MRPIVIWWPERVLAENQRESEFSYLAGGAADSPDFGWYAGCHKSGCKGFARVWSISFFVVRNAI